MRHTLALITLLSATACEGSDPDATVLAIEGMHVFNQTLVTAVAGTLEGELLIAFDRDGLDPDASNLHEHLFGHAYDPSATRPVSGSPVHTVCLSTMSDCPTYWALRDFVDPGGTLDEQLRNEVAPELSFSAPRVLDRCPDYDIEAATLTLDLADTAVAFRDSGPSLSFDLVDIVIDVTDGTRGVPVFNEILDPEDPLGPPQRVFAGCTDGTFEPELRLDEGAITVTIDAVLSSDTDRFRWPTVCGVNVSEWYHGMSGTAEAAMIPREQDVVSFHVESALSLDGHRFEIDDAEALPDWLATWLINDGRGLTCALAGVGDDCPTGSDPIDVSYATDPQELLFADGPALIESITRDGTKYDIVARTSTELDADADGVRIPYDNCPNDANPSQLDHDYDGVGDDCDPVDDLAGWVPTIDPLMMLRLQACDYMQPGWMHEAVSVEGWLELPVDADQMTLASFDYLQAECAMWGFEEPWIEHGPGPFYDPTPFPTADEAMFLATSQLDHLAQVLGRPDLHEVVVTPTFDPITGITALTWQPTATMWEVQDAHTWLLVELAVPDGLIGQ